MYYSFRSNDPDATKYEAPRVHAEGIEVFAVGVTQEINQQELEAIASHKDHQHVYNLNHFDEFEAFISEILKRISRGN